MDDPARYRKLQEGALKRAKELSVQNATQKLIEIYTQYAKK